MRGRKPLPKHLRLVQGNRGKRPIKTEQVEATPSLPSPPVFLCDDAKQEWQRVAPMLFALRLLSELDVGPLSAYCQSYAVWQRAITALNNLAAADKETLGLVAKGANGSSIAHPLLKIANKAAQDMVRYASEFALTPIARARLASPPGGGKNPGDKYFE